MSEQSGRIRDLAALLIDEAVELEKPHVRPTPETPEPPELGGLLDTLSDDACDAKAAVGTPFYADLRQAYATSRIAIVAFVERQTDDWAAECAACAGKERDVKAENKRLKFDVTSARRAFDLVDKEYSDLRRVMEGISQATCGKCVNLAQTECNDWRCEARDCRSHPITPACVKFQRKAEPEAKARCFRHPGDGVWIYPQAGTAHCLWLPEHQINVALNDLESTAMLYEEITIDQALAILTEADWPEGLAKAREMVGEGSQCQD